MSAQSPVTSPSLTDQSSSNNRRRRIILTVSRLWPWVFLLGMIILFTVSVQIFQGINFLTIRNSQNILVAIVPVLLMGMGQTFVIISGGIDLSVGWTMGLSSVVSALVIRGLAGDGTDVSTVNIAIIIGFAAGVTAATLCGLVNGVIIAKLRVPSFIVTLGMSFIARGIAFLTSGGNVVGGQPIGLRNFGNEALIYVLSGENGGISFFQKPDVSGEALQRLDRIFPWPVVVAAIVLAVGMFLLHKTQFGRHTFAIGGSPTAALRSGIPVDRHTIILYGMSAFTAGVAGMLHTARYWGGSSIAGDPLLLSSIAAVIIGGVSLFGGSGSLAGTLIGALIIAVLTTGLVLLNVQPFWQFIVVGVVVILAVLIDQTRDLVIGRAETG